MALTFKDGTEEAMPQHSMKLLDFKLSSLKLSPLNPSCRTTNKLKIGRLKTNLFANGHIEPLTVVKKNNKFMIINGHRRYTALKMLGVKTVKCIYIEGNNVDYDKMFTALHVDTEKITAVQECERWLKGATHISKRILRSIEALERYVGKTKAKYTIQACVTQNVSPTTLSSAISQYAEYANNKTVGQLRKVAYYLLNISSPWKVRVAIDSFMPIETLNECIAKRKPLPEITWG